MFRKLSDCDMSPPLPLFIGKYLHWARSSLSVLDVGSPLPYHGNLIKLFLVRGQDEICRKITWNDCIAYEHHSRW